MINACICTVSLGVTELHSENETEGGGGGAKRDSLEFRGGGAKGYHVINFHPGGGGGQMPPLVPP